METTIIRNISLKVVLVRFADGTGFVRVRFVSAGVVAGWNKPASLPTNLLTNIIIKIKTNKALLVTADQLGSAQWFPKSMIRIVETTGNTWTGLCENEEMLAKKIAASRVA